MKKLRKPPVGKVKEKKREPLAEGLQIVPTSPSGRRLWKKMNDKEIIEFAAMLVEEKGIIRRKDLERADRGVYSILHKRGLLDEVGFEDIRRERRLWSRMSNEEIVRFARRVMREKEITRRGKLQKADSGLYDALRKRGLFDEVEFAEKRQRQRPWRAMSDEEILGYARKVMEEKEIDGRSELEKADSGLYGVLRRRGLLERVEFEERLRFWKNLSDEEIVKYTREFIGEKGITVKSELNKIDPGLCHVLRKRGLLDEIGFEEKQRNWKDMSDEEIVEYTSKVIEEKEVSGRNELDTVDSGLYEILRQRGLLDRAFARMEQQRDNSARDAVIDALTKFANNEKPEAGVA